MQLQALSLGREVDVWSPRTGVVHSAFVHAVNLSLDRDMWTVLGAVRQDAPFGIRIAAGAGMPGVKAGEPVNVRAGFVGVGKLVLDCRTASRWVPAQWGRPAADLRARLLDLERAACPRAWFRSATMARDVTGALQGPNAELSAAVRRTVGRGPGLTPAGDDVLVGILLLLTSGAAGPEASRAASRLVSALAPVLATTTDISRHLLDQAARGLPGRTLHDLGRALVEGAPHSVFADALSRVLATGSTSGADACMGLVAACRYALLDTELLAA
ncbi:MAG: DUF2877 domain-containing protein [Verrucomicrobiales bacterium]